MLYFRCRAIRLFARGLSTEMIWLVMVLFTLLTSRWLCLLLWMCRLFWRSTRLFRVRDSRRSVSLLTRWGARGSSMTWSRRPSSTRCLFRLTRLWADTRISWREVTRRRRSSWSIDTFALIRICRVRIWERVVRDRATRSEVRAIIRCKRGNWSAGMHWDRTWLWLRIKVSLQFRLWIWNG